MSLYEELTLGESRTLEFKLELPEDTTKWMRTIVAFANGVDDIFFMMNFRFQIWRLKIQI